MKEVLKISGFYYNFIVYSTNDEFIIGEVTFSKNLLKKVFKSEKTEEGIIKQFLFYVDTISKYTPAISATEEERAFIYSLAETAEKVADALSLTNYSNVCLLREALQYSK